jgi:DtxR family Mn-dependent transcriptional regulator
MELSTTQEDYLKCIWHLEAGPATVRPAGLSEAMDVRMSTCLSMLKNLQEQGFLVYERATGVRLTQSGRQQAALVVRKHRLIESFLQATLGLDNHQLHAEAERIEHVISDFLLERIDAFLDYPVADPHGQAIPAREASVQRITLDQVKAGQDVQLFQLPAGESRAYYLAKGLTPGSRWSLHEVGPEAEFFILKNSSGEVVLSRSGAAQTVVYPKSGTKGSK